MCLIPRPLRSRVSLLCKAFNRDNFPKTRAAKRNPCWLLHFMASSTSILSLVFAGEATTGAKSEWSSIGPAFAELRALTRTSKGWKIPTHTGGSRRPSFSVLMLRLQELWSSPSLFSSSMPPPESGSPLILVGFAVFNRRVRQHARRGEGDRARAGSSLVDFEGIFFGIFEKSYARGRRETKKIKTVA